MRSKSSVQKKVGITGGIGSGKTFICKKIESLGYPVFYSDIEAKRIMNEDPTVVAGIIELMGDLAYEGGKINSVYLAEKIFNDPNLLQHINNLVHPAVRQAYDHFVKENSDSIMVFNEAAILFETGAYKNFDFNILITAPKALRIKRITIRDSMSESEILARMKNQWSDKKKIPLADFIIVNNEQYTDLALITVLNQIVAFKE